MTTNSKKISLRIFNTDYNWAAAFGNRTDVGFGGSVSNVPSAAVPGSDVSLDPIRRKDVNEILAVWENHNDGWTGVGLFRLKDGRYVVASGCAEYTGWDCGGRNNLAVSKTLAEALVFGMNEAEAECLDLLPQRKLAEPIFAATTLRK